MTYENNNVDTIIELVNSYYEFPVVTATKVSVSEAAEIDPEWVEIYVLGKNVELYRLEFINGEKHLTTFPATKLPVEVIRYLAESLSRSFLSDTDDLMQLNYMY